MQLNLSNIHFCYPQAAEPILCGVTATFPQGWTGIVGDNGCGKTTLARIACGLLEPDSGSVGPSLVCAYCIQDATMPPPALEDFAMSYDGRAIRLRRELNLEDDWPWRYETLSGGQQKRLQVACTLWTEPDVLVMDEPTNHVDASTRDTIARALEEFAGIGILISHDRELLDRLCSQCLFMGASGTVMRPGGYTQASGQATSSARVTCGRVRTCGARRGASSARRSTGARSRRERSPRRASRA